MHLLVPRPDHKIDSAVFLATVFLIVALFLFSLTRTSGTLGSVIFILNGATSPYLMTQLFLGMKYLSNHPSLNILLMFAHYPVVGFVWGLISPIRAITPAQAIIQALKRLSVTLFTLLIPGLMLSLLFMFS